MRSQTYAATLDTQNAGHSGIECMILLETGTCYTISNILILPEVLETW
jgi:hypothetical protein